MALPFWLTKLLVRTRIAGFTRRGKRLTNGGGAYLRYYSDRVLAAPVEELLDPAFVPDPCGPDVIDLNLSAPRSESGVSLGRFNADRRGNPPSHGLAELRTAIAERDRREGRNVNPETDVLVTHGATGATTAAIEAFVNPGDRVVLFDPCSPLVSLAAKSRRASVRWVPSWTEDGRTRYLANAFEKAMRGAKLLILSDPVNPTGGCLAEDDLDHIAWIAAAYDVLVLADESLAKFRFTPGGKSLALLPGAEKRVLTTGSVTQEFGLGALRVGWLAGSRHLVQACKLTQSLSAPFVPVVCQQAAARLLAEPDTEFSSQLDRLKGKRDYTVDRVRAMGLEPDLPTGGFFVWVPVAALGLIGREFAGRLYRDERVQVGPGCAFGPSGEGHVRISIAGDDGRLRAGLSRMAAFVQRLKDPGAAIPVEPNPPESNAEDAANESQSEPIEASKPTFSRV